MGLQDPLLLGMEIEKLKCEMVRSYQIVNWNSRGQIFVGLFFWSWAVWNMIKWWFTELGGVPFDLGVVSFATVIVTGIYGLGLFRKMKTFVQQNHQFDQNNISADSLNRNHINHAWRCLLTHGFVAFNYGVGIALIDREARQDLLIYFSIAMVIFFIWGVVGYRYHKQLASDIGKIALAQESPSKK